MYSPTPNPFLVPTEPFGAEIPDFDLGNEMLERLRNGTITLTAARETVALWHRDGRFTLARAGAQRLGMDLPDYASASNVQASPVIKRGLKHRQV